MHALRFSATGSLDNLHLENVPAPAASSETMAVVDIRASGINPSDIKNVLGRFPYTTLPRTPGRDYAGVVTQGPAQWLGAEVWGSGKEFGFTLDGSHAEQLLLPAASLARKAARLSFAQAATCGVPYITAWDALERTRLGAGDSIVVIGANGTVGRAALALACWRGAKVIAAVRKPEQAAALQRQDIPAVMLEDTGFASAIHKLLPAGADVIFDTTGFWLAASVTALATWGRIAVIAAPVEGNTELPVLALYRRGGSVVGINSLLYDSAACVPMLARLASAFDNGFLPPPAEPMQRPLSDGLAAYREVQRGGGKIVLVPD